MIQLNMEQLMNSVDVIQKLINSPTPLSAKISYQIIRIAREVESEYNLFQKSRTELIEKYAKKDENQKPILENDRYQIVPDEQEDFTKEYNEIMGSSIELNVEPLALTDKTMEELKLTPLEWMKLEPFVK